MTGAQARALLAGPLRFGDAQQIEAVAFLAQIDLQHQGGPWIVCTLCEDPEKPVKRHRIGCPMCAECGAKLDAHLDGDAEPTPNSLAASLPDGKRAGKP